MLEILSILGSLASIASLVLQSGVPLRSDGTADIDATIGQLKLDDEQRQALQVNGSREIIAILVIDSDLLEDIRGIIAGCLERYRKNLKTASNRAESDRADKSAERCVCEALNRIKRRNNGQLPRGEFERWWKSYRCIDDYDY